MTTATARTLGWCLEVRDGGRWVSITAPASDGRERSFFATPEAARKAALRSHLSEEDEGFRWRVAQTTRLGQVDGAE